MTATKPGESSLVHTTPEQLLVDFASRGLVVLAPESLGVPVDVHERIYAREKDAFNQKVPITASLIPEILDIINAPGVVHACNQLVGENWAIVPFTHNAPFASGSFDQHWHKDDNGAYNGRKHRHHQPVQIEMLYYPQEVREDMGPTATVPFSHYWTFNHEENHDNFAGADHLDFAYHLDGMERQPVSGPKSSYDVEDIVARRTKHDIRMRKAVTGTGWPLVQPFEAAPLRAGSVVLYSHNLFHRGNHRRDDWRTWKDKPRFMWRFWLYRTTDPTTSPGPVDEIDWRGLGVDPLTNCDLTSVDADISAVWRHHHHWMTSGQRPQRMPKAHDDQDDEAARLFTRLHEKGDAGEPVRIGAAYRLASDYESSIAVALLSQALHSDRENVRRAAIYGLVAVGPDATRALLDASTSPVKWVRKAGVFGLGETSPLTSEVLRAVEALLWDDVSVYVRSVAAGSLGCLGRRAVATGQGLELVPAVLNALMKSLGQEENRLGMNIAQGRSIKLVRPTDESDVCEGIGLDFGVDRFKPVRSAVRENALWSVVMLCSHGPQVLGTALQSAQRSLKEIVRSDDNAICVGFAMDALVRLANLGPNGAAIQIQDEVPDDIAEILEGSPIRSWESLSRMGLGAATALAIDRRQDIDAPIEASPRPP